MKARLGIRSLCLLLLICTGQAGSEPATEVASDGPPVRRALLIGINDYERLPDLNGALNDVQLVREILAKQLGFEESNITELLDGAATRAGILEALETLVARSRPHDFVYLHYSGHGSQALDPGGDEAEDLFDETLVPHDARTFGVADIVDDELAAILARLPSDHAIIVLDSCHSGTATRGSHTIQTRSVPRDTRAELYATPALTSRAIVPVIQSRHVLFTASASNQSALDGPVDGQPHGLFTYALARSIAARGAKTTPRAILRGAEKELQRIKAQLALSDMPEPQLEAPRERLDAPIVPGGGAARLPWVSAEPAGEPGRGRLLDAAALGAQPGSIWAIYPPGETDFPMGQAVAEIEIAETRGPHALGELQPPEVELIAGSRAIVVAAPLAPGRVPILWLSEGPEHRELARESLISLLPQVDIVGRGEFARFAIELRGDRCTVYSADGTSVVARFDTPSDDGLAASLAALLARSMSAAELMAIDNPASAMTLSLSVNHPATTSGKPLEEPSTRLSADTRAPRVQIRGSATPRSHQNSLQLVIESDRSCYLTLVDVDSEGKIHLFFPNAVSETRGFYPGGLIPAGQPVLIPDSLEPGNRAGFHIDYAPPAGTDTIRAFCSTDPDMTEGLREAVSQAATERGAVRELLTDVLRPRLARVTSRGLALVVDEETPSVDWVAASLTIRIEP